jgi:hypothetical protein
LVHFQSPVVITRVEYPITKHLNIQMIVACWRGLIGLREIASDRELRLLKAGNLKKLENIHIEQILAYSPHILEQCDQSTTCWQMDNIWPLVIILEKAV